MSDDKDLPVLCIDLDGVLHSYVSGWKGAGVIPDPPVPGAKEFVRLAQKHFRVVVFSARSGQPGGLQAMQKWLAKWGFPELDLPEHKPPAQVYIDDAAWRFEGTWPRPQDLLKMHSWVEKLQT